MVEAVLHGVICGMAGFLIAVPLTMQGEILSWWPAVVRWLIRAKSPNPSTYNSFQFFIFKLTHGCAKCVSGQLAFWSSLVAFGFDSGYVLTSVIVAVFFSYTVENFYEN